MNAATFSAALAAAIFAASAGAAHAAVTVTPLPLPAGYVVDPPTATMSVDSRGDVAVLLDTDDKQHTAIVEWLASRSRVFVPPAKVTQGENSANLRLGALGPQGQIYAQIAAFSEGATLEETDTYLTLTSTTSAPFATPCGTALPDFITDDGSIGLTFLAGTNLVSVDNLTNGTYAPDAKLVRGSRCIDLGPSYLTAARGEYLAGYRGYVDLRSRVPAPSNANIGRYSYVAVRWIDLAPQELGPGVALAVSSLGTCVGTDGYPAPDPNAGPGLGVHATAWYLDGSTKRLLTEDAGSIAQAVDDSGRIAGTLIDAATKTRYAFLVDAKGKVVRLDSLLHDPAWHLEYADAFLPDGAIAGIGTHGGVPAVFELRGT